MSDKKNMKVDNPKVAEVIDHLEKIVDAINRIIARAKADGEIPNHYIALTTDDGCDKDSLRSTGSAHMNPNDYATTIDNIINRTPPQVKALLVVKGMMESGLSPDQMMGELMGAMGGKKTQSSNDVDILQSMMNSLKTDVEVPN